MTDPRITDEMVKDVASATLRKIYGDAEAERLMRGKGHVWKVHQRVTREDLEIVLPLVNKHLAMKDS